MKQDQYERIGELMAEMEREDGPVSVALLENARRLWSRGERPTASPSAEDRTEAGAGERG